MADVPCPRCRRPIALELTNTGSPVFCAGCRHEVILDVFPAAFRPAALAGGFAAEGAATCFFHEERAAQAACDGCGRYVCALCDVPVGRQHLCPECLESRHRHGRRQTLPNERMVWDRFALALAVLPLPLWMITILTAPAVLYIVIRHWRSPGSLVDRAWPRFAIAGALALAELGGIALFIVGLAMG